MKSLVEDSVGAGELNERLVRQEGRFKQILSGLESRNVDLKSLSLGVDQKAGVNALSVLPSAPEIEKIMEQPGSSRFVGPESSALIGGSSSHLSRLLFQHAGTVNGSMIVNHEVFSKVAGVLKLMREVGLPIRFKSGDSYHEVIYGRNSADSVKQALVIMNQLSTWDLAEQFGTFQADAIQNPRRASLEEAIVDNAFFLIDFPDQSGVKPIFPVDMSLSIRDPNGSADDCLSVALALRLGRMGATSRASYKVEGGHVVGSNGLVSEKNHREILEWWLQNPGIQNVGQDYVVRTTDELPIRTKAFIFRETQGDVGALVSVKPWQDKDEELVFYLQANLQKHPGIVAAANKLIAGDT
jgi:hypothetical protein